MPTSASFVQHSLELLSGVGPVRSRPMFGGHGLSLHGISIGIIDDDRLYLRVDDLTRPQFQEAGAQPFTYPSKKGPMVMKSYWSLPDEAVDDPDVAVKWGRLAAEASVRGEAAKRKAAPSPSRATGAETGGKAGGRPAVAGMTRPKKVSAVKISGRLSAGAAKARPKKKAGQKLPAVAAKASPKKDSSLKNSGPKRAPVAAKARPKKVPAVKKSGLKRSRR